MTLLIVGGSHTLVRFSATLSVQVIVPDRQSGACGEIQCGHYQSVQAPIV